MRDASADTFVLTSSVLTSSFVNFSNEMDRARRVGIAASHFQVSCPDCRGGDLTQRCLKLTGTRCF